MILPWVKEQLKIFLEEDLFSGDITTDLICGEKTGKASIIAKEEGILAGNVFAAEIFKMLGSVDIKMKMEEGRKFKAGDRLMEIEGNIASVLMAERTALNLMQKLSGIATKVKKLVEIVENRGIKLLDTRKTTPGFRYFEKYAVRIGGGYNHRFGLYDLILIKDNHKRSVGGIRKALKMVKVNKAPYIPIEVEVEDLEELQIALEEGADIIMLDNFSPEDVKKAVEIIKGKAKIEVSGGINEENIKDYAIEGVNFISVGSAIPSSPWIDMSLEIL